MRSDLLSALTVDTGPEFWTWPSEPILFSGAAHGKADYSSAFGSPLRRAANRLQPSFFIAAQTCRYACPAHSIPIKQIISFGKISCIPAPVSRCQGGPRGEEQLDDFAYPCIHFYFSSYYGQAYLGIFLLQRHDIGQIHSPLPA